MISIHDFHRHIEIAIRTRGYDNWQGGNSNLLITRTMVGQLSNTSNTTSGYSVPGVVAHLATRGVQAVEGRRRTASDLQGMYWRLTPPVQRIITNPTKVTTRENFDGSLSLKFSRLQEY